MDSLDKIFDALPALVAALREGGFLETFDQRTLVRANGYANGSCIQSLRIKEDSPGNGSIIAEVKGTESLPYRARILFKTWKGKLTLNPASCTCPVSYQCKHLAGVMSYLEKRAAKYNPPNNPLHPLFDWETEDWLKRMKMAVAKNEAATTKPATPYNKILIYCIEKNAYREEIVLNLRVGTLKKSGEISLDRSLATADVSRPPKYMSDEDLPLVIRYRALQRQHYDYQGLKLEGKECGAFLEDLIGTERLFIVIDIGSRQSMHSVKAELGEEETVRAVWQQLEGNRTKPALEFSRKGTSFTPTEPPFYIDFATGDFGKLKSDIPGNLLRMWTSGPAIQGNFAQAIGEKLGKIPGKLLPLPVKLEEKQMPTSKPEAILRIWRTQIARQATILANPFYRYGESPLLLPADAAELVSTHSVVRGNTRLVWQRDPAAEEKLLKRLWSKGFEPLAAFTPTHLLNEETFHSLLRVETDYNDVIAWLDFLESEDAKALEKSGWKIEVDPESGLKLHDVSEFFPEIESDPDHGIDWFRFDVSGELDGKRFSLIPHIAAAIEEGILESIPYSADDPQPGENRVGEFILIQCENPADGYIRFPSARFVEICQQVAHLFRGGKADGPIRLDRLGAADVADSLAIDSSETTRSLARLARNLKNIGEMSPATIPAGLKADLRAYQTEGFSWLQFLAENGLHGILADDMGLGKTIQTLTHLCAETAKNPGRPSLVIAPTSVVPNWAAEAEKFTPSLKILVLHGAERSDSYSEIPTADVVITSYPLLTRDMSVLGKQDWHSIVLDEAQYIKNPKAIVAKNACKLKAAHRICLSGTPMENHLGELWSLMRFLMPGFLGDEKTFNSHLRRPIERDRSSDAQRALNRRISPLILRRTKDQVATELPEKTEIIHHIDLTKKQTDLYESVRAAMDKRVRDAIAAKGLAKSHIIVLDALLKLRQICCHPQLLSLPAAQKITESAKLDYLTTELLPTLLEEGRRILLFSQFTSMLALIEAHLEKENIPFLKLTGQTKDRATLVKKFQAGEVPVFLISLKAGGTGLNLTAADTVIHYDPWWNPAAENQATDRAHRIGQNKPVFVHKLACTGTIEDRILDLQKHKSALVEALLSEETSKLKIDSETLSHLLSPLD
ncbi:MAG: DEAD/DEAH box helicase [Akkermansiaceae bacterium]|nr:DEAD/DEAH box helicase [Akkermansiaceae bacterium]